MTGMGFRGIDWTQVAHDISGRGYAKAAKTYRLKSLFITQKSYENEQLFRDRIVIWHGWLRRV